MTYDDGDDDVPGTSSSEYWQRVRRMPWPPGAAVTSSALGPVTATLERPLMPVPDPQTIEERLAARQVDLELRRERARRAVRRQLDSEDEEVRRHLNERLLTVQDLATLPAVRPLVDGLVYRDTLAQVSGAPGSYKTFLTVAMACSVVTGRSFEGHAVPQAGSVVYVCAEGATGMRARVLAWCEKNGADPAELHGKLVFLPEPLHLASTVDVSQATEVARDRQAALMVLDTRARCTIGLEENSATDQGRAIDALERIQRESGAAILAVHHSGRAGEHGRGSNAWDGAVWSDLRLSGEDMRCKVHCAKHKDVPDGCDHHYRLIPHTVAPKLMPECDDQQRSTLVIVSNEGETFGRDAGTNVSRVQSLIETCALRDGLTTPQIVLLARDENISRATVHRTVKVLVSKGALRNVGTDTRPKYLPTGAYRAGDS